jgi:hypothetical protein
MKSSSCKYNLRRKGSLLESEPQARTTRYEAREDLVVDEGV